MRTTTSGTPTTPNTERKRKMVMVTLSDQARRVLARLARMLGSKSRAVEVAILALDWVGTRATVGAKRNRLSLRKKGAQRRRRRPPAA